MRASPPSPPSEWRRTKSKEQRTKDKGRKNEKRRTENNDSVHGCCGFGIAVSLRAEKFVRPTATFRGLSLFGSAIAWSHRDAMIAGSLGVWPSQPFGTVPAQTVRHATLCKRVAVSTARSATTRACGKLSMHARCSQNVYRSDERSPGKSLECDLNPACRAGLKRKRKAFPGSDRRQWLQR